MKNKKPTAMNQGLMIGVSIGVGIGAGIGIIIGNYYQKKK